MRFWIVLALVGGFAVLCNGFARAADCPTFAGVPWGSDATKVKSMLVSKGFTFEKVDADGDLDFMGEINGQKVAIYEFLTPAKLLVKSNVVFLTPDDEVLDFYDSMKATLSNKYGDPNKHYEFWMDPYTDRDSESAHETALAAGKGQFMAFWDFHDGGHLWVRINKRLAVDVNYESPGWIKEADRREHGGNSVL